MKNKFLKKLSRWLCIAAAAVVFASAPAEAVHAASLSTSVATINKVLEKSDYQMQATRYTTDGTRKSGICNICAMTNLLNRNLALDGVYSDSKRFDIEYVTRTSCYYFSSNGLTVDAAKSMTCQYNASTAQVVCNYDTDGYMKNPIYTVGGKNYQAMNVSIPADPEKYIAELLDTHHEGVFIRAIYDKNGNGHCIVVTSYTKDANGNYTFYVIDTASSSFTVDQKLSDSWMGKKYKAAYGTEMKLNSSVMNKIIYLKEVSTPSAIVMDGGSSNVASTLSINLTSTPITVTKGKSFNLTGTISSNKLITSASAKLLSGGSVLQQETIQPNAYSVDIKSSKLNANISFGKLAAGSYTLRLSATDASGKTKTMNYSVTVKETTTNTVTINVTSAPTTITYGKSFNLAGTISSSSKITSATAKVLQSGVTKQSYTIYPNTTSVDIKSSALNQKIAFGKLARGSYTLQIKATNAAGKTATYTKNFTVK